LLLTHDERGRQQMLGESLLTLAARAGQTVVDAAMADEWETAQHAFTRLLGRRNTKKTRLAKQRLEETREQLMGPAGTDVGLIREALAIRWTGRFADFLEENPDAEAELQALIQEIRAAPPTETLPASNHATSANGIASTDAAGWSEPEHPGALAARSELAYSIGQDGDAAAARDQFAVLLPVAKRVLGPMHPDTLTSRHNLANFAGYAGDAATAQDQFAALLPVAERVLGADSPDTLAARFNLAYWTGHAGDAAAARDQFAALLSVRERICGPEHAETLAVWYQLAHWTALARDAAAPQD
jgi:Tetratricopeptide repeat